MSPKRPFRECLLLRAAAAQDFARASVPKSIFHSFMLASVTALRKRDGGVRGIATGTVFRRLVAWLGNSGVKWRKFVRRSNSHYQHGQAWSAGHAVRAVTDADHSATVLSVDGVGAYDHVLRASMLKKLEVPKLRQLLPFVRQAYVIPS